VAAAVAVTAAAVAGTAAVAVGSFSFVSSMQLPSRMPSSADDFGLGEQTGKT